MSYTFIFETGDGRAMNDDGYDPMELTEEEDPYKLDELASYSAYMAAASNMLARDEQDQDVEPETSCKKEKEKNRKSDSSLKGNRASNEVKAHAVHLVDIHPKQSARAVVIQLKLDPRTVQRWYKTWKADPDSLFKTIGRPRIIEPEGELAEATKDVVTEFHYKEPTATADQLLDHLTRTFSNLTLSKRTQYRYLADLWLFSLKRVQLEPVERNTPERIESRKEWVKSLMEMDIDYMTNCVFIDEAGFHANLRRTQGWAPVGETPTVKVITARANPISILGAISAKGLIKICLRKPIPPSKKRKLTKERKVAPKGTVTNHYLNFIENVLDEMNKYPEMKGHYLIMDNAPIHTSKKIRAAVESRGYKCIYLPAYSPELNPIEQFWSVIKSNVKRGFVLKKDTLPAIIADASIKVLPSSFEGFAHYSVKRFQDCLDGLPI